MLAKGLAFDKPETAGKCYDPRGRVRVNDTRRYARAQTSASGVIECYGLALLLACARE